MENFCVVAVVLIGIPIVFILKMMFNKWLYTEGPFSSSRKTTKEDDLRNLQTLRDRGNITEEQYLSAVDKIENIQDEDVKALSDLRDKGIITEEQYQKGLNELRNKS